MIFTAFADMYFMKHFVQTVDIQTAERDIISAWGVQVRMYSCMRINFPKHNSFRE